ncbi:MAG: FprA family A-type flavoprotein [bacterium]|nr:FprA family A-type flavoprotein [bacterium]
MKDIIVKENIFWVGYVDWDIRDFHGYHTDKGSTYNSYLILDEKITVIDSVKAPYADSLLKNIQAYTPLNKVSYVVCNHAEPDHSGSLPVLMEKCQNAELVCNAKCKVALSLHYDTTNWKFKVIDESTSLSLGKNTLNFVNTPMAHWPESMATYVPEQKLLFSMDGFGQHYASSGRFDYDENLIDVLREAKKYYANIIMLYGKPIEAVLNKASKLEIDTIAPSHGVIWKKHIAEIIERYKKWIVCKPDPKVVIFYDTMWKSTGMMANAIYEGALHTGVKVRKYDLKHTTMTDIATEVLNAAAIAVGSPTLNKSLMPKAAEVLTYLRGLAPTNKSAIAFGSYGWAKKSGQHDVLEYLKQMNCKLLLNDPIQSKFVPTEEVLEQCREAGKKLTEEALKYKTNPHPEIML